LASKLRGNPMLALGRVADDPTAGGTRRLTDMLGLPRSARLAAWADSWLTGEVTLDEVVARVHGDDEPHTVTGFPAGHGPASLSAILGSMRASGAQALRVALPRPGDPQGLSGPPELTVEAVAAGEAVVCVGAPVALVPTVLPFGPLGDQGHLVSWGWHPALPPPSGPTLVEAEQALARDLIAAASALSHLDVAAWRPEVGRLLDDIRSGHAAEPLPRPFPPPAQALAARAARVLAAVEIGLSDDGLSLTAASAQARRATLVPLERAARHALAAACNVLAG
jgi:hypothetical protein